MVRPVRQSRPRRKAMPCLRAEQEAGSRVTTVSSCTSRFANHESDLRLRTQANACREGYGKARPCTEAMRPRQATMLLESQEPRLTVQSTGPKRSREISGAVGARRNRPSVTAAAHIGVEPGHERGRGRLAALALIFLVGCAAHKPVHNQVTSGFWRTCDEAIDVHKTDKDGWKKFLCTDVNGLMWEVLVRLMP